MSHTARVIADFKKVANPKKASSMLGFKSGKGEYGEGDIFYGLTVPEVRVIAKKYQDLLSYAEISHLLKNGWHEVRLAMLIILVYRFKKGSQAEQKKIFNLYLQHTKWINNWDLVDVSAHYIVGAYLHGKPKTVLYKLARSKDLWEKRIAMVATFYDIRKGKPEEAFKIADMLIHDKHDLIHKASGWMLREAGKNSGHPTLEKYLRPRVAHMPRTALRYAIEHFPEPKRKKYLRMK